MGNERACIVRWAVVGGVLVNCITEGTIDDETLDAMLTDMRKAVIDRSLGLILGPAHMTGMQRLKAVHAMRSKHLKSVVLTDSPVTRGILTALSWLDGNISGCGLDDMEGGLDRLELSGPKREAVRAKALQLRAEVTQARHQARSA